MGLRSWWADREFRAWRRERDRERRAYWSEYWRRVAEAGDRARRAEFEQERRES